MTDKERHQDEQENKAAAADADQSAGAAHEKNPTGDAGPEHRTEDGAGSGHGEAGGSSRKRSESWSKAHEAFERLNVEEKAFFLVESAFETMLTGLREAGDAVRNAMDEALSDLEKRKQEARGRARRDRGPEAEHTATGTSSRFDTEENRSTDA